MRMTFKPQDAKQVIEDFTIFSTCLIGDGAQAAEEVSLFTVPQGQFMPQIPRDAQRCTECHQPRMRPLTRDDTCIVQAGQFGSAIGDARLDRMRAVFTGGKPVSLDATVTLHVAGKRIIETTLEELAKGWVQLEDEVPTISRQLGAAPEKGTAKVPHVLVSRYDTVEARITMNRESKIEDGPILVRIEMEAKVARDPR